MAQDLGKQVLKGVSRSFYLSLRLLPAPMRSAASVAYLLARTSDTVADSPGASVALRKEALEAFAEAIAGGNEAPRWTQAMFNATADTRERHLLERAPEIFAWRKQLPPLEGVLVDEVVGLIIDGQRLDLERFSGSSGDRPVVLENARELEDYAWRVAGCVGAFWTKLGFLTLGGGFSSAPEQEMIERGIAYGKGLQLVNILRDLPRDLAEGRCYLPVEDPTDRAALLTSHAAWLERAKGWISQGRSYARDLPSRRLRTATVLPALLAEETLSAMEGVTWEALARRIKVPRRTVYLALAKAWFAD